jgi:hypothetical protein
MDHKLFNDDKQDLVLFVFTFLYENYLFKNILWYDD